MSCQAVEEFLAKRDIEVDQVESQRWVQRFKPVLIGGGSNDKPATPPVDPGLRRSCTEANPGVNPRAIGWFLPVGDARGAAIWRSPTARRVGDLGEVRLARWMRSRQLLAHVATDTSVVPVMTKEVSAKKKSLVLWAQEATR